MLGSNIAYFKRRAAAPLVGLADTLLIKEDPAGYLQRTFTETGNRKKGSIITSIKCGKVHTDLMIFQCGGTGVLFTFRIFNDELTVEHNPAIPGTQRTYFRTKRYLDDNTAWYHLLARWDTTKTVPEERFQVFVNGTPAETMNREETPLSEDLPMGAAGAEYTIGGPHPNSVYLNGFIYADDQYVDIADTGAFDKNSWVPKVYAGPLGNTGFYLDFKDNLNWCKDAGANSLDFTPTAGLGPDNAVKDTPADNYCVIQHWASDMKGKYTNGMLRTRDAVSNSTVIGSFAPDSGKWYFEVTIDNPGSYMAVGAVNISLNASDSAKILANCRTWGSDGKVHGGPTDGTPYGTAYKAGDVIGLWLDITAKTMEFYLNGVSQARAFAGLTMMPDGNWAPAVNGGDFTFNFGATPFKHTIPGGCLPLHSANLPEPDVINGRDGFDSWLFKGTEAIQSLTSQFAPFPKTMVLIKNRSISQDSKVFDTVRGFGKSISTNLYEKEKTELQTLSQFNANGFTLGIDPATNKKGDDYLALAFKGMRKFGFDIVRYSGDGVVGRAVGHDLQKPPEFIFARNLTGDNSGTQYHVAVDDTEPYNFNSYPDYNLGVGVTFQRNTTMWGGKPPTHNEFYVSDQANNNGIGSEYIAYLWTTVPGFCKVGGWVGNNANQPCFVYTGFRPAFLMIRNALQNTTWYMLDDKRSFVGNKIDEYWLYSSPDKAVPDQRNIQFFANGFGPEWIPGNPLNGPGARIIYVAMSAAAFKYSHAA
jgi:hypothetical protein